jgi:hypothetical protein
MECLEWLPTVSTSLAEKSVYPRRRVWHRRRLRAVRRLSLRGRRVPDLVRHVPDLRRRRAGAPARTTGAPGCASAIGRASHAPSSHVSVHHRD